METRRRLELALLLAAALGSLAPRAQARTAVELPLLDRTAQSVALGDGGATLSGVNALGVNPAGLYSPRAELLTQYQQLPLQTSLTKLAASYPLSSAGATVALSYLNLRSANFDGRDDSGNAAGRFSTQDQLIGLHLSRPVGEASPLTAGVSVKYLRMGIEARSADALAFDVGGRYAFSSVPLALGLSVLNLGRGPRFGDQTSALPVSYALSASYRLIPGLELLGNLAHRAAEGREEFNLGMQYWVGSAFAFRGRCAMAPGAASQGSGLANLAGGLGFKLLGSHTLDYSFQPFESSLQQTAGAGTHLITLTMRFGPQAEAVEAARRYSAPAERDQARRREASAVAADALQATREGRFALATVRLRQAADANPGRRDLRRLVERARGVAEILPEARGEEGILPWIRQAAQAYVFDGDAAGAAALLRKALNQDPADDRVLALLNRVEREAGLEITQRSGENPGATLVEQKIEATRRALLESNTAVAMKRAKEALTLEPRNLAALQLLGSAYYLAGDATTARRVWRRVRQLDPGNEAVARFLKGDER